MSKSSSLSSVGETSSVENHHFRRQPQQIENILVDAIGLE
jgi:hypothetical protein